MSPRFRDRLKAIYLMSYNKPQLAEMNLCKLDELKMSPDDGFMYL